MSRAAGTLVLLTVFAGATTQASAQGTAWVGVNVGSVSIGGAASINRNGRMKISGEGTDIWSTADGFYFVYQRLAADGIVTARVASLQNTDGWAKAGVMVRQSLDGSAANAALVVTPSNGLAFQVRPAPYAETTRLSAAGSVPAWLRLARTGNSVTAYSSTDGARWQSVGTATVPFEGSVYVGLAVTSRRPAKLTNAWLESASLSQDSVGAGGPPPASPPVAAWAFDEGMGTLARDSFGVNHGTVSGALWTSGRYGTGLVFDGLDDVVTVADAAALRLSSAMTVSGWVRPSSLSGWRSVAAKEAPEGHAYALYANNDSLQPTGVVNLDATEVPVVSQRQLELDAWSHIAVTFDGQVLRFFVNGAEANSRSASGTVLQTSGALRIGGTPVFGEWFHGTLDDVRVYDRALSGAEIQADMSTPVPSTPFVDTTPPAVALTSPASGATLAGSVTVAANATDDVEMASVQFRLNGSDFGAAVTSAPYSVSFDTRAVANGTYTLTAVASDAAGNKATSAPVTVTVSNATVVMNVKVVEFTSVDQATVRSDGQPVVSGYTLEIWTAGSDPTRTSPYRTSDLGKPATTSTFISVDQEAFLASLPKGQQFFATVRATGPGGSSRSSGSNAFSLQ